MRSPSWPSPSASRPSPSASRPAREDAQQTTLHQIAWYGVSLLSDTLRQSGCGGRSIAHLLERIKTGEDMVGLLAVTRLIPCNNVRLFEASSCPWTPPSTVSKRLYMERIAFDLAWGTAVYAGRVRRKKRFNLLLQHAVLEGGEELFGCLERQTEMRRACGVLLQGDEVCHRFFPAIIAPHDPLQLDAHGEGSSGSGGGGMMQVVLPEFVASPQGRVPDVHFPILHAMLMPSAEGERYEIIPVLCPRCHTDQVMQGGKPKVHI